MPTYDNNGNMVLTKRALDTYAERYFDTYWRINPVSGNGVSIAPVVLVKFQPGAAPAETRSGVMQAPSLGISANQEYDYYDRMYESYVLTGSGSSPKYLPSDHPGLTRWAGTWIENVTVNGTGWDSMVKVNIRKGGLGGPTVTTGLLGTVDITGPGASYWQVHQSPITATNRLEVYVKRNQVGQNIPATTFRFTPNYQTENPIATPWNGEISHEWADDDTVMIQVCSEHYADWEGSSALIPPDSMTFQRVFHFFELMP